MPGNQTIYIAARQLVSLYLSITCCQQENSQAFHYERIGHEDANDHRSYRETLSS